MVVIMDVRGDTLSQYAIPKLVIQKTHVYDYSVWIQEYDAPPNATRVTWTFEAEASPR